MTDRPDATVTARYELADTTTAADLAELLLTVPADARITFSVPSPPVQSYAVAEVSPPRALIARWTVPAGQPLTPPNVDETPAAGWADHPAYCHCTIEGVMSLAEGGVKPPAPLPQYDPAKPGPHTAHARGCTLDTDHSGPCRPQFASGGTVTGHNLDGPEASLAARAAARQALRPRTRRLNALDLGGTGL